MTAPSLFQEDSDADSINTTTTAGSAEDSDKVYAVEKILAERFDDETSQKLYLLKYEKYPLDQCTWEPKSHLSGDTLVRQWQREKLRVRSGEIPGFDVREFEEAVEAAYRVKREKKRRRVAKRRRRGEHVSSSDEEPQSPLFEVEDDPALESSADAAQLVEESSGDEPDLQPTVPTKRRKSAPSPSPSLSTSPSRPPSKIGRQAKISRQRHAVALDSDSDVNTSGREDQMGTVQKPSGDLIGLGPLKKSVIGSTTSRTAPPPKSASSEKQKIRAPVGLALSSVLASTPATTAVPAKPPNSIAARKSTTTIASNSLRVSKPVPTVSKVFAGSDQPVIHKTKEKRKSSTGTQPQPSAAVAGASYRNLRIANYVRKKGREEPAPIFEDLAIVDPKTGRMEQPKTLTVQTTAVKPNTSAKEQSAALTMTPVPIATISGEKKPAPVQATQEMAWQVRKSRQSPPPGHRAPKRSSEGGTASSSEAPAVRPPPEIAESLPMTQTARVASSKDHSVTEQKRPKESSAIQQPQNIESSPASNVGLRHFPEAMDLETSHRQARQPSDPSKLKTATCTRWLNEICGFREEDCWFAHHHVVNDLNGNNGSPQINTSDRGNAAATARIVERPISTADSRALPEADDLPPARRMSSGLSEIHSAYGRGRSPRINTRPKSSSPDPAPPGPHSRKYSETFNNPQRRKTETCKWWLAGSCSRSEEDCWFAHHHVDPDSARSGRKIFTCWYWHNAKCVKSDEECQYAHWDTGLYAKEPSNNKPRQESVVSLLESLRTGQVAGQSQAQSGVTRRESAISEASQPSPGEIVHREAAASETSPRTHFDDDSMQITEETPVEIILEKDQPAQSSPISEATEMISTLPSNVELSPREDQCITPAMLAQVKKAARSAASRVVDVQNAADVALARVGVAKLNMIRLVEAGGENEHIENVYIHMPPDRKAELEILHKHFARFNRKVYSSHVPNTWKFVQSFKSLLIIVHPDETFLGTMRGLGRYLMARGSSVRIFSIGVQYQLCTAQERQLAYEAQNLFPHGGITFITDDIFAYYPEKATEIIAEFLQATRQKPPGGELSKISARPGIRKWTQDLAQRKFDEAVAAGHQPVDRWIRAHLAIDELCPWTDYEPSEMQQGRLQTKPSAHLWSDAAELCPSLRGLWERDEMHATNLLANYFAAAALTQTNQFRKFIFVYQRPPPPTEQDEGGGSGSGGSSIAMRLSKSMDSSSDEGIDPVDPHGWARMYNHIVVMRPDQVLKLMRSKK